MSGIRRHSHGLRLPVAVGLVLLPVLLASVLLGATWRTDQRTARIEAAVVNNDKAVTVNKQVVPLGRQLAAQIVADQPDNVNWTLSDPTDAADGLASGRYAVVVTIPANFSAAATSYSAADTAHQATIDVTTSQTTGVLDPGVARDVAVKATDTINSMLTQTYLDNIYVGFNTLGEQFATMSQGASRLADGATQLADGTTRAAQGVAATDSGLGRLSAGAGTLAAGSPQLTSGAAGLAGGVRQYTAGTAKLVDGVGQLSAGLGQVSRGLASATGMSTAQQDQLTQLKDGAAQVATGVAGLGSGLGTYRATLDAWAAGTRLPGQVTAAAAQAGKDAVAACSTAVQAQGATIATQLTAGLDKGLNAALPTALDQGLGQALPTAIRGGLDAALPAAISTGLGTALPAALDPALGQALVPALTQALVQSGIPQAQAAAIAAGVAPGVATGVAQGVADPVAQAVSAPVASGVAGPVATGISPALAQGVAAGVSGPVAAGVADGIGSALSGTLTGSLAQVCTGYGQAVPKATLGGFAGGAAAASTGLTTKDPATGQSLTSGAAALATGAGQLSDGVSRLVTQLPAQAAAQAAQLKAGIDQLAGGAATASSQAQALIGGGSTLSSGAQQLATGLNRYTAGAGQLADGLSRASAGTGQLKDGMAQLDVGATTLSQGTATFAKGLAEGRSKIPSYSQGERDTLKQVVARPVAAVADPSATPATSTALLLVLALWLGALASFLAIRPVPHAILSSSRPSTGLLGDTLRPGLVISTLQALALTALAAVVLTPGLPAVAGLAAFLVFAGVVFVVVNHALAAALGWAGRVAAALLAAATTVVGLTSAVPGWVSGLAAASPLTPAMTGVRSILGNGTGLSSVVGGLVLWLVLALVTGMLVITRRRQLGKRQLRPAPRPARTG